MKTILQNIIVFSAPVAVSCGTLASVLLVPVEDWPRWIFHEETKSSLIERALSPTGAEQKAKADLASCGAEISNLKSDIAALEEDASTLSKTKNKLVLELEETQLNLQEVRSRESNSPECTETSEAIQSMREDDLLVGTHSFEKNKVYFFNSRRSTLLVDHNCYIDTKTDGKSARTVYPSLMGADGNIYGMNYLMNKLKETKTSCTIEFIKIE